MALPYFPWYPNDFLSDLRIRSLSFAEQGLYFSVLNRLWLLPDCKLPADDNSLLRFLSPKEGSDAHWRRWLNKLVSLQLLVLKDGFISSESLSLLHAIAVEKSKKAKRAALARSQPDPIPGGVPDRPPDYEPTVNRNQQTVDSKHSGNSER